MFLQESGAQAGTRWVSAHLYHDITWENGGEGVFGLKRAESAPGASPAAPEQLVKLDPACGPQVMTNGWETVDMTLRRNGLGQLGFHVKYDGTVAEVEDYGFAWQAGLRQGSRLVEICKVAVVTLTHDQMIDLLRTSVTVKVVIIPPFDDGTPRR